ncbi:MAG TPA: DNRLRE domain-containing protein, partial [Gaiellaceae bacterium]|nr:DNRLRE domain-containing protein [Gaiellaceae bacterium]
MQGTAAPAARALVAAQAAPPSPAVPGGAVSALLLCLALLTLLVVGDASAARYTPRGDAEVLKDRPNSNFGKKQAMRINGSPVRESLVMFDVASLSGPVVKATLRIYATRGTKETARLYRTGTSWTEAKVTWNTRPARTTGVVASRHGFPANVWVELDVTSQVTGAGTFSFGLATLASKGATFATREAARKPELVVAVAGETEADTKPPTVPAELTPGAASQTSVALSWRASTDDVGVAGYGVYRDGTKVLDVSGTSATIGSLACGTSYSFTVDARDAAGNRSGQSAPLAAATAACDPPPPPSRVLWGTAAGGAQYGLGNAPWDMRALDRFEQNAGKRVSILHFGQSFRNSDGSDSAFPAAAMQLLRERGIIPLLNY